jgi:hypothetical protein
MQVKQVYDHVSTCQDAFTGAQAELVRQEVGASSVMAHRILIRFSYKKMLPFHRDALIGRFRNEHDKHKFRRHRYRRIEYG